MKPIADALPMEPILLFCLVLLGLFAVAAIVMIVDLARKPKKGGAETAEKEGEKDPAAGGEQPAKDPRAEEYYRQQSAIVLERPFHGQRPVHVTAVKPRAMRAGPHVRTETWKGGFSVTIEMGDACAIAGLAEKFRKTPAAPASQEEKPAEPAAEGKDAGATAPETEKKPETKAEKKAAKKAAKKAKKEAKD